MKSKQILLPALIGALGIAAWYFTYFMLREEHRFFLPRPDAVVTAFSENLPALLHATLNTGLAALLGLLAATAISFGLALLLSLSPLIRAGLYPYLSILQMMPTIILAPILILWVGPGLKSVVIITFLICFFPLVVNTTQGLISTDRNLVELFKTYRATRSQELWLLRVPSALPYFFTGLRIAATLAPIAALVGDYTAGSSAGNGGGLGFLAVVYSAQAKFPALFATAAITCALGFAFVAIVLLLSWSALHRWHDSYVRSE